MNPLGRKQRREFVEKFRATSAGRVRLKDCPTAWRGPKGMRDLDKDDLADRAKEFVEERQRELSAAQELLFASDVYSVLIVLQAMDAAGKDGLIKHVMSGVNPSGCQVFSFKKPTDEELDHDFLWRYVKNLPERGRIGIFNRSYYEEVLIVKVRRELVARQRLPPGKRGKAFWNDRYEDINALERHLVRNGTVILKFFLHMSKGEQKQRFLARLGNEEKHWKFSAADLEERAYWNEYQSAFEDMLDATNTKWAPWWIIPADYKWGARVLVASIIASAVDDLRLSFPPLTAERRRLLKASRARLEKE
jgi:PPK2 family polyphosphate:nucleotide phosphotransferase